MPQRDDRDQRSSEQNPEEITSLESLRQLYLAERHRRQDVRSQLAIPVSIISFSIFGYVSLAQYFDVSRLDPVTIAMDALLIPSLVALLLAMVFLARVEFTFMRVALSDLEDLRDAESEYEYFRSAYFSTRTENAAAARHRARGFLLLLLALALFVGAVTLLPFHLSGTDVHGRSGAPSGSASGPASAGPAAADAQARTRTPLQGLEPAGGWAVVLRA